MDAHANTVTALQSDGRLLLVEVLMGRSRCGMASVEISPKSTLLPFMHLLNHFST